MKAYILATGTRIEPFGDPVGEIPIANLPLAAWQRRIFAEHGLEVAQAADLNDVDAFPCVVVWDKLLFSQWALRQFLRKARAEGRSVGAALAEGPYTTFTRACQGFPERTAGADPKTVPYGLWYLAERPGPEGLAGVESMVLEFEDKPLAMGDVDYMGAANLAAPAFNFSGLLHIDHWIHVWMGNLFAIALEWFRLLFKSTSWGAWLRVGLVNWVKIVLRVLWAAVRGLTLNPHKIFWNVFGAVNVVGKGCNIHPTAVVEGSILGDRVKIGPFCIVQASVLGDDVKIGPHSIVNGSVMGPKSTTSTQGIFSASVCFEGAMTGRQQLVLQGRRSFMAGLARFFDTKMGEEVKVEHKGKVVGTGLGFLGGCVGHDARIGAGVWLGTARSVPNGARLVLDPQHTISRIPADLDPKQFYAAEWGSLKPLGELAWVQAAAERKKAKKEGGE